MRLKIVFITGEKQRVELTVKMKRGAWVKGRIVNSKGAPVTGLGIWPMPHTIYPFHLQDMLQLWRTDQSGVFDTSRREPGLSDTVPPGSYTLSISPGGRGEPYMRVDVTLKPGLNDLGDIIWKPTY